MKEESVTLFIAYAPGKIEANTFQSVPAHVIDIQPTILDLAGVKYPKEYNGNKLIPQEGLSFKSALEGKEWKGHDLIYWEHEGNRAVRKGDWKIVSWYPKNEWELYNINADRTELNNLAETDPEKVKELSALYAVWAARAGVMDWSTIKK